jgi:uncharacterized protein (TIGR03067 family)
MRSITLISFLIVSLGFNTIENVKMKPNELNGTWVPIRQEMAGKPLPAAGFSTQKLVIDDNRYTFTAESVDKGEATYADGKMDLYGKDGVNKGRHFTCIYKLENGELTICYNLSGDGYPKGFETSSKPKLFLSVFKKI